MVKLHPDRAQAGAASATWLIIIAVLWLMTMGLAYTLATEIDNHQQARADAEKERQAAIVKQDEALRAHQALSNAVGYSDGSAGAKSDEAAIATDLATIKAAIGASMEGKQTLGEAVAALLAAYDSNLRSLAALDTDLSSERAKRQSAETAANDVQDTFSSQVSGLSQQLADAQGAADSQASNDQSRFDDLLASEDQKDQDLRQARAELDQIELDYKKYRSQSEGQLKALKDKKAAFAPELPDGAVLSVSDSGTLGFIDVGGRDGLTRGTRFEILRRDKAGALKRRGFLEVREVESDKAMVGLIGAPNPYDPVMLPGDAVRSPLFDKGKNKHFFLLGQFPLTLSKEFIAQRLGDLGGVLDDSIGVSTDVLVLGYKDMSDEFAPDLTETDEFAQADKLGTRIVRLVDLEEYLRY